MIEILIGPLLLIVGVTFVYLSNRAGRNGVRASGRKTPGLLAEDRLLADVLSEMLSIRHEVAGLQDQIGALKARGR